MCEKSKEIQKKWKIKKGDYFYYLVHRKVSINCGNSKKRYKRYPGLVVKVFLPRQDQLQEMIGDRAWEWFYFNFRLAEEYRNPDKPFKYSSEQIGLMRYMDKKHHKKWNGDKWEAM